MHTYWAERTEPTWIMFCLRVWSCYSLTRRPFNPAGKLPSQEAHGRLCYSGKSNIPDSRLIIHDQVYGPCILLVVISWVSFWLNREATSDRISLGITTVLTMTFMGLEARKDLPKVTYPTALDYFVFISFMYIFSTVVQVRRTRINYRLRIKSLSPVLTNTHLS